MIADRPIAVTADYSTAVEETDPRAAWQLYATGRHISEADVERYGLAEKDGKVVFGGSTKAIAAPGGTDGEEEGPPEWPLKTSPADYLKRNPDGPNALLARRILGE